MRDLLGQGAYYSWLQENVIQAQYFKDPFRLDWYLASSGFLADVNNDRKAFNTSYADALLKLRRLVLYEFENDITVVPRQSAHFGFYNGSVVVSERGSGRLVWVYDSRSCSFEEKHAWLERVLTSSKCFRFQSAKQIPLNDTVGYKEDRLGLRTLDQTGRLTLATCPGFHMQFTLAWFEENVTRRYLGGKKEDTTSDA